MHLLEFNNLCFSYEENSSLVLDNFSLAIPEGKVVAVLGPNGTGKTTMLMLALGWLKPDSGQIIINDLPIEECSRNELGRMVSLVPQFEPSFFDFSLLDFALLGRAPYLGNFKMPGEEDLDIAFAALERVGMQHKANHLVTHISGGEHQLVLLARSLAQQTKLLLLDEPTSHLDICNKSRLIKILRDQTKAGKTIVFTTHEPDVAALIADFVVMIKSGHVAHSGSVNEVMTAENLSHIYETPIKVGEIDSQKVFLWS